MPIYCKYKNIIVEFIGLTDAWNTWWERRSGLIYMFPSLMHQYDVHGDPLPPTAKSCYYSFVTLFCMFVCVPCKYDLVTIIIVRFFTKMEWVDKFYKMPSIKLHDTLPEIKLSHGENKHSEGMFLLLSKWMTNSLLCLKYRDKSFMKTYSKRGRRIEVWLTSRQPKFLN